ncbi:iron permease [Alicyclobacillus cycloheptanicus]|uniref:High-affinity iron transporter n=1 Tax=Alicyclobacillus cycloheptanicus TaxID=1457 RepID=A0ABT9XMQ7_9BACL|nr:FTR1 family protein [Alicyclobacillus cycloheptanicus]MDQ0191314.1 high-affinity iron transporter [Alicyclobacillus cycloheptanicus]WDM00822.1 iron permease [Alicyclobacillus cycloheptanicus]
MKSTALRTSLVCLGGAVLLAVLVWQAVTAAGNPDPTAHGISPAAGMIDTAVLVYREGLECILVLSAVVAGLIRTQKVYWKPIAGGAGIGFAATLATWFVLVGILALAATTTSENNIQAATGLLAIVVLLVVMNWFFHRIYWTGWIAFQNRKKKELISSIETANEDKLETVKSVAYKGLVVLGFASVYREGFEVDLFLQSIRMQVGTANVVLGTAFALVLIGITGYFTFIAHQKLPYKKMLVFTGVMLGVVFEIMVGEQVNEMQLANWIPTHSFALNFPAWAGTWFSLFNNWETVIAQVVAAVFIIGSFYAARMERFKPRKAASAAPSATVSVE